MLHLLSSRRRGWAVLALPAQKLAQLQLLCARPTPLPLPLLLLAPPLHRILAALVVSRFAFNAALRGPMRRLAAARACTAAPCASGSGAAVERDAGMEGRRLLEEAWVTLGNVGMLAAALWVMLRRWAGPSHGGEEKSAGPVSRCRLALPSPWHPRRCAAAPRRTPAALLAAPYAVYSRLLACMAPLCASPQERRLHLYRHIHLPARLAQPAGRPSREAVLQLGGGRWSGKT